MNTSPSAQFNFQTSQQQNAYSVLLGYAANLQGHANKSYMYMSVTNKGDTYIKV